MKKYDAPSDDFQNQTIKYNHSKFEHDLYKEEDDVKMSVVRVKRTPLPNNGENWKILVDNKIVETIDGAKFPMKERVYLRSVNGTIFMIKYYKCGWKSLADFKSSLKKHIKTSAG